MKVELLHKRRAQPLPGVTATQLASNAWELVVPVTPEAVRWLGPTLAGLDGAVLLIDDAETEPALISGQSKAGVKVTVWRLS